MPLVRINVIEGRRTAEQLRAMADTIQSVMVDEFGAPQNDRYQIISQHRPGGIIVDDSGLGFQRSDDVVILEVTQQGRTNSQKASMFRVLADRLGSEAGLSEEDLIVSVIENRREDWSFGRGEAQFIEGKLQ